MATTKAKRSVHKKQSAVDSARPKTSKRKDRNYTSAPPGSFALIERKLCGRRFVDFPHVNGKTVKRIHLYTSSDYHCITIDFEDGTCLNLEIEPNFVVNAQLQQLEKGDIHIVAEWPAIRSQR